MFLNSQIIVVGEVAVFICVTNDFYQTSFNLKASVLARINNDMNPVIVIFNI